jgi:peptidoglycan/LPS O-acetylase OafA/YrhL
MSPHVTPIRYRSLQALRALAAVSVMLHNANFAEVELLGRTNRFLPGASLGEVGVDLFFVLSGFLMVRTTGATAAGAEASRRFLMSRALRIYPAYWTVALVWAGLLAVWPVLGLGRPAAGFLQSILLLPAEARPQLAQGWSLVFEVYFYLVFGLMLLLPLVPRQWALTLWAAVLLVGVDAGFQGATPWTRLLANPLALEFLLGAAIAAVIDRPPRWPWALLLFGGPVLFLGEYARTHLGEVAARSEMLRVLLVGAPAGAVVMGAVQLERSPRLAHGPRRAVLRPLSRQQSGRRPGRGRPGGGGPVHPRSGRRPAVRRRRGPGLSGPGSAGSRGDRTPVPGLVATPARPRRGPGPAGCAAAGRPRDHPVTFRRQAVRAAGRARRAAPMPNSPTSNIAQTAGSGVPPASSTEKLSSTRLPGSSRELTVKVSRPVATKSKL